ncbi:hypothetical protein R3P38DRAFT_3617028 [Favolaschia claudopus]|uniref:Uncharacterized protein n=1 Tax=Favolaschia claudopus TaxID=2862362 RepID=A0AAW0A2A7_9AGAR
MSVGPNLPLHALSKPAIRFLYQSQVKKYIKGNENHPLSEEKIAVFGSYLEYSMIIDHLQSRLELLELEACFSTMEMDVAASKLHDWVMENETPDVLKALKYFSFAYRHCLPTYYRVVIVHEIAERLCLPADDNLPSFISHGLSLIANIHDFSARTVAFAAIFQRTSAENSPFEVQHLTCDIFTSYIRHGPHSSAQLLDVISRLESSDRTRTSIMKSLAVEENLVPNLLQDAACTFEMCAALANLAQTQAASVIMLNLKLHLILVQLLS